MFSREEADKFLLYRFNNHKINIMLEKKFDFGFIYEISQNEFKIFKKYLNNNLVKEFIRLNHSFAVLLILFIRKSNKGLRFYVNYRALNAIIIKNQYLLSLIQKTLSRIYKIRIYIIFNIIVVFNKLRMIKKKK